MSVLQVVKKLAGSERAREPASIRKAREALEAATAHFEATKAAQSDNVSGARRTFEMSPTDENADALAVAERRAELMIGNAQRKVAEAQAELARLEGETTAAKLATIEEQIAKVDVDLDALQARAVAAVRELAAIAHERDAILHRAANAEREAAVLRGGDRRAAVPNQLALRSKVSALRHEVRRVAGADLVPALTLLESPGPFGGGGFAA